MGRRMIASPGTRTRRPAPVTFSAQVSGAVVCGQAPRHDARGARGVHRRSCAQRPRRRDGMRRGCMVPIPIYGRIGGDHVIVSKLVQPWPWPSSSPPPGGGGHMRGPEPGQLGLPRTGTTSSRSVGQEARAVGLPPPTLSCLHAPDVRHPGTAIADHRVARTAVRRRHRRRRGTGLPEIELRLWTTN